MSAEDIITSGRVPPAPALGETVGSVKEEPIVVGACKPGDETVASALPQDTSVGALCHEDDDTIKAFVSE